MSHPSAILQDILQLYNSGLLPFGQFTAGETQAVKDSYAAGMLDVPVGTRAATINGIPTWSVLLDAGAGGTVDSARVTFLPPTDTIGAQRLHTPTDETESFSMDSARYLRVPDLNGFALTMHAIGISLLATLTGEVNVAESDYTLAEYQTNDLRFEWLDCTPTRVLVSLQRGSSTRYALLSVTAEVSA